MNQRIRELITLHVTGEISPAELAELKAVMEQDPAIAAELAHAEELWKIAGSEVGSFQPDSAAAWEQIQAELTETAPAEADAPEPLLRPLYLRPWTWAAAAAVAILATVGVLTMGPEGETPTTIQEEFTATRSVDAERAAQEARQITISAFDADKRVQLPDCSKVWLSKGSQLCYNAAFGRWNRQIGLDGEAWFDVERNEKMSFVVDAGNSQTRVLGTIFNVTAWAADNSVEVSVIEGLVAFGSVNSPDRDTVRLKIDETGVFDRTTHQVRRIRTSQNDALAMRVGKRKVELVDARPAPQRFLIPEVKIGTNILKQTVLNIELKNESPEMTFSDIEITVTYQSRKRERIKKFKLNGAVSPNDTMRVKRRLSDLLVDSEVITIEVTSAKQLDSPD